MALLPGIVLALLVVSALIAASETAVFALVRMEHTREQLSTPVRYALNRLARRPLEALFVAISLGEAANIFAECLATTFLLTIMGPNGAYVAGPLMFFIVMLFCDITPKTFALSYPAGVAKLTAKPLAALTEFVHPVARRFTPFEEAPRPAPVSETEFKALVSLGVDVGEVQPNERALIHRVFDFSTRRASDVMTPRAKVFSIDIATPERDVIATVTHGHFSRVPVYRGESNNIVGVLNAKDLVARRLEKAPPRIERLIRPPYCVPPGKLLGDLFDEMRRERCWIALVVDEYGKMLGLITLEDLLEELFGEIQDEFDFETPEIEQVGPGEWLVSGAIDMHRLAEHLGANGIQTGGARTLSAAILRTLGRVPTTGDKVTLGSYEATAERVGGASVEQVRLRRCQ